MKRPLKYSVIDNQSGKTLWMTNQPPTLHELQNWRETEKGVFESVQTKTAYVDTRYEARLRLWKWWLKKQGVGINRK